MRWARHSKQVTIPASTGDRAGAGFNKDLRLVLVCCITVPTSISRMHLLPYPEGAGLCRFGILVRPLQTDY